MQQKFHIEMNVKREKYLRQLLKARHNHLVKIITGLRRAGKSYLLFNIFQRVLLEEGVLSDHIISMAFDDYALREYRNPDKFYNYVKERIKDDQMYYVLLDEVQMLDNFVDVLNGLLYIPNVDVYVTGSNARFLSSDIATEFRGRGVQIHISPLSFNELMSVYEGDKMSAWMEYMRYGGLPMVALAAHEDKADILRGLVEETYINDIKTRNTINNEGELTELLEYIASNIGSLTNPSKLADTFRTKTKSNISVATIQRYISYFIDSFLIEKTVRYDVRGKQYIDTPHKYYFSDMGLRNVLLGYRQFEPTHIMENIIYNELRNRGYQVDVGQVSVVRRNAGKAERQTMEVDFVCNKAEERWYIQSAYSMPDKEKLEQEKRSLCLINDNFRKTIITADMIPSYKDEGGIEIMNIFDFLMQ